MKFRILDTVNTAIRLERDNIPSVVVQQLLGKVVVQNDTSKPLEAVAVFMGQESTWCIAPDCVELLPG